MHTAAFCIYMIVLVLAPLCFGAVHPWAFTLVGLLVMSGGLLTVAGCIHRDPAGANFRMHVTDPWLALPWALFLLFLLFQMLPMPHAVLRLMSPESATVGGHAVPVSRIAVDSANVSPLWDALAPYALPVRLSAVRWTVYGIYFLGLAQVLDSRRRITLTLLFVIATCCFDALYGLVQTFSGTGRIWWYGNKGYLQSVTGTYINRNHFAGLMEMGIILAAAWAAGLFLAARARRPPRGAHRSLRARLSGFLAGEQRLNQRLLVVLAAMAMGGGLFLSASRGGMLAAGGGLLCLGLLISVKRRRRRKTRVPVLVFALICAFSLHLGVNYPLERFNAMDQAFESRSRYAARTMDLFEDYWLAGVGPGNFRYAYPRYQDIADQRVFIRHAHNDFAQFAAETGLIGLVLLAFGLAFYTGHTLALWRKRSDPVAVCLGSAPLAVLAAIGFHSLSDFNLHIPANCMMLAAVMAVGTAALHLHGRARAAGPGPGRRALPLNPTGFFFCLPCWC